MAISVRALSNNSGNPVNTLSVTAPAGTTTGDIVLVLAARNAFASGDTVVDNNGSTPFTSARSDFDSSSGATLTILYRRIQAGDPSSYSFTFAGDTGATTFSLLALAFQDVDPSNVFNITPGAGTLTFSVADGGSLAAVNITTTVANTIHIIASIREAGAYTNTPAGYTSMIGAGATQVGLRGWYKVIAAAGATGAQTLTAGSSTSAVIQSFAMSNAAATGYSSLLGGKFNGLLKGKL